MKKIILIILALLLLGGGGFIFLQSQKQSQRLEKIAQGGSYNIVDFMTLDFPASEQKPTGFLKPELNIPQASLKFDGKTIFEFKNLSAKSSSLFSSEIKLFLEQKVELPEKAGTIHNGRITLNTEDKNVDDFIIEKLTFSAEDSGPKGPKGYISGIELVSKKQKGRYSEFKIAWQAFHAVEKDCKEGEFATCPGIHAEPLTLQYTNTPKGKRDYLSGTLEIGNIRMDKSTGDFESLHFKPFKMNVSSNYLTLSPEQTETLKKTYLSFFQFAQIMPKLNHMSEAQKIEAMTPLFEVYEKTFSVLAEADIKAEEPQTLEWQGMEVTLKDKKKISFGKLTSTGKNTYGEKSFSNSVNMLWDHISASEENNKVFEIRGLSADVAIASKQKSFGEFYKDVAEAMKIVKKLSQFSNQASTSGTASEISEQAKNLLLEYYIWYFSFLDKIDVKYSFSAKSVYIVSKEQKEPISLGASSIEFSKKDKLLALTGKTSQINGLKVANDKYSIQDGAIDAGYSIEIDLMKVVALLEKYRDTEFDALTMDPYKHVRESDIPFTTKLWISPDFGKKLFKVKFENELKSNIADISGLSYASREQKQKSIARASFQSVIQASPLSKIEELSQSDVGIGSMLAGMHMFGGVNKDNDKVDLSLALKDGKLLANGKENAILNQFMAGLLGPEEIEEPENPIDTQEENTGNATQPDSDDTDQEEQKSDKPGSESDADPANSESI